jgi:hypothetical protein
LGAVAFARAALCALATRCFLHTSSDSKNDATLEARRPTSAFYSGRVSYRRGHCALQEPTTFAASRVRRAGPGTLKTPVLRLNVRPALPA